MVVLTEKQVGDTTLQLIRDETGKSGKQYEYFVTEVNGNYLSQPVYTRDEAEQQLANTVQKFRQKSNSRGSNNSGGGGGLLGGGGGGGGGGLLGGGGGLMGGGPGGDGGGERDKPAALQSFGAFGTDDSDDDKGDEPRFPWM